VSTVRVLREHGNEVIHLREEGLALLSLGCEIKLLHQLLRDYWRLYRVAAKNFPQEQS
jgi:hypothetical protein